MSVNEEFLVDLINEWLETSELGSVDSCESGEYPGLHGKLTVGGANPLVKAILQHFQQEQERVELKARLEELGEIQLQHGRHFTVTHINGVPQLIRDRIAEVNNELYDLLDGEVSSLPKLRVFSGSRASAKPFGKETLVEVPKFTQSEVDRLIREAQLRELKWILNIGMSYYSDAFYYIRSEVDDRIESLSKHKEGSR